MESDIYCAGGTTGATTDTSAAYAYNPATKKATPFGAPGYMKPSWSPDGRWIAVTRQTPEGTDVAILDGRGRVSYVNRAARRILGISESESMDGIAWRSMYTRATRKLLSAIVIGQQDHLGRSEEAPKGDLQGFRMVLDIIE